MEIPELTIVDTSKENAGPGVEENPIVDANDSAAGAPNHGAGSGQTEDLTEKPAQVYVQPETQEGEDNSPADPSLAYATAAKEWGQTNGFNISEDEIKEIKDQPTLNALVEKKYVERGLQKDPLMLQIYKSGLDMNNYLTQMTELQNMKNTSPKDIYVANKVKTIFEEEIKLKKIDPSNEDAKKERLKEIALEVKSSVENVSDDIIQAAIKPIISDLENQINTLPETVRKQQEAAAADYHKQMEESYNQKRTDFLKSLNHKLDEDGKILIPFNGQANKDEFIKFVEQQTNITDLKHALDDGTEQSIRDIPFMNRLVEDPDYRMEVLRLMYMMEAGELTDINNIAKKNAVDGLGLTPIVRQSGNQSSTAGIIDTSKPH